MLERAGIQRADLVVAVTGDDEDNLLICQVAKEKYLCERIIARVNNPRNLAALQAARHPAGGLGHRPDPAPDRARGAALRPRAPARPARRSGWRSSSSRSATARPRPASAVAEIDAARRRADHLRAARRRRASCPRPTRVIEAGDEVLVVLDPGLEEDITAQFVGATAAWLTATSTSLIVGGGAAGAGVRRGAARRAASAARSCWSAASPTRPTSARRARRATSRASRTARTRCLHPTPTGTREHVDRAAHAHERDEARHRGARRDARRPRRSVGYGARCWPPARTCGGCASTARSSRASTTCARSATPTRSAPTPRTPSASCSSAAPTSPARSRPR